MLNSSTFIRSHSHQNRAQFLAEQCSSGYVPRRNLHYLIQRSDLLDHLGFVLPSHSLFYCSVPKVATRTLLNFITYLHLRDDLAPSLRNNTNPVSNSTIFSVNYLNQMLSTNGAQPLTGDPLTILSSFQSRLLSNTSDSTPLDLWQMYQDKALPLIRLRSLPDSSILFSTSFTRVIFVRHPLERLASAYIDKVVSRKAPPWSLYDNLRRGICRSFASSYLKDDEKNFYHSRRIIANETIEPCATVVPTFEHFVEYITSTSAMMDVHWQPYSSLCHVCDFKYDFIGKYETIHKDLDLLMSRLNLPSRNWSQTQHFSTGQTQEKYKSMYGNLPDRLICRLKHVYRDDLKLFDYRFEDYWTINRTLRCFHESHRRFPHRF